MPEEALPDPNPLPGARRRSVLAGGAGAAALAPLAIAGDLIGATPASAATPAAKRMFRHGVASGDPRPRSVVLWTRQWEVATDQWFKGVVQGGEIVTGPKQDHTVKVDATGLKADRWYFYRFRLDGVTSAVGRTRTATATPPTADRRELFDHMVKHQVKNAVFLTGDIHSAWANDLPIDPGTYPVTGSVGVEFVCTSVTSDNIDEETGAPPRTATLALEAVLQTNNRHVRYLSFDDHGYSVLDLTPQRAQMDYYVLADKKKADTTASHTASWLTRSGSGTVEAADGPVA